MYVAVGRGLMRPAHEADAIAGQRGGGLVDYRVSFDHEGIGLVVVLELAAGYFDGAMMGLQHHCRGRLRCLRMSAWQGEHGCGRERNRSISSPLSNSWKC